MKKILTMAALLSSAAFADTVTLNSINAGAPMGASFTFNYELNVAADERYEVGDFFTIYDFAGFVGAGTFDGASAAGFTVFATDAFGPNAVGTTPLNGETSALNVTFKKTSAGTGNVIGAFTLAGFRIYSNQGCGASGTDVSACVNIDFTSEGTKNVSNPSDGQPNSSTGGTLGPNSAVPEPATMSLMGGALLGLGLLRRRK